MAVTIRDVAKKVGRSITTVSRALNDYDDVSEETRRLIKKVAAEMGYQPSRFAQQLRQKRTDTLGFIMPTYGPRFSDPFFSEFLAGVGNTAAKNGYDLLVATRPPGDDELDAYLKNIRSRRVDGFIIVRTRRNDPRIELLKQHQYPFAVFGRIENNNDFPLVDENSELGMQLVVKHLLESGHRRIGFIAAPDDLMFGWYRQQGFRKTLREHGIELDESLVVTGDLTQRSGRKLARTLLTRTDPPTAIVAGNDLMAIGALTAAQNLGLEIGKDIAITGFDDIPWAENTHPPLTTVRQPIYQIGTLVTEMLIDTIRGEPPAETPILLQPSLVVRASSLNRKKGGDAATDIPQ